MKIIISNYRYFISGGPERYLFSIKDYLESKGHQIFPFSVQSKKNLSTKWEKYFLSPMGNGESVYFEEYKKNFNSYSKMISRAIYSPEGFLKSKKFAKQVNADIVYSLHFLNKMSPSVIDGFKAAGMPVVVRISDFGLICPQGHLFHSGKICEKCLEKNFFSATKRKCIKNSFSGSLLKSTAWTIHKLLGCTNRIDAFIAPSKFTINKFISAGFPEEKFFHIPTFIDTNDFDSISSSSDYVLYFGRFVEEKGVHILLDAYARIPNPKPKLILIGDQFNSSFLKNILQENSKNLEIKSFMPQEELNEYIKKALFVVVPSLWYDNFPNVVLEAYAHGKAVLASGHGCFNELVIDGKTGLLFQVGDPEDLAAKMNWAINNQNEIIEMGKTARSFVKNNFSPEMHYSKLIDLFKNIISEYSTD